MGYQEIQSIIHYLEPDAMQTDGLVYKQTVCLSHGFGNWSGNVQRTISDNGVDIPKKWTTQSFSICIVTARKHK